VVPLNLIVPESMKEKFRKPYGKLFSSVNEIKIPSKKLITVGDVVSYNAIEDGLNPDIIVVDLKKMRVPVDEKAKILFKKFKAKEITVRNPAGNITDELQQAVKESLKEESNVKIFVNGEEDLAVLPFILESPLNTVILYGLKDKGVMVKVSKRIKNECRKLLKYIEEL
jgi:uncharacterized protein (UPF0218 family)